MAFTVEDGTIVAGANSYTTVADADSYFGDRANADWAALDTPTKQSLLVKATDYLVQKYRNRWKGMRVNIKQTLDWPRAGVQIEDYFDPQQGPRLFPFEGLAFLVPTDIVPDEVKHACCEAAIRAKAAPLAPDLKRGGMVKSKKIDVIETEYFEGAPATTSYQAVEMLIKIYLKSGRLTELLRS